MQIMDPKEKALLDETLKLSRENNKMLKKMYSAMRVSRAFKVMYWIVIIGSMFGLYYYFQPFIENIKNTYDSVVSMFGNGQGIPDSIPNIGSLLKN